MDELYSDFQQYVRIVWIYNEPITSQRNQIAMIKLIFAWALNWLDMCKIQIYYICFINDKE